MLSRKTNLVKQIAELSNKLADPSISVAKLFTLLDIPYRAKEVCYGMKQDIEDSLSTVNSYPSESMESAISNLSGAFVSKKFFKNASNDVRVAVASCISDIMRIYAPDLPYDENTMRAIFLLVVSSFENLSDKSTRSYAKRSHILKIVAGCELGAVMLNLECHGLIVDMFHHFFKEIRDYHPESVFSSMETIMTHVIEKNKYISPELVSPILAAVKKDNKVLPIVKELGEKVLQNCESKLKPCFAQLKNTQEVIASPTAAKRRGRDEKNSGEILKIPSNCKKKRTSTSSKEPKGSGAPEVPRGDGPAMVLPQHHLPPSTATAMADEDGPDFLIKAMASFPTNVPDQSLSEKEDTVAMGLPYLTDKDKELFLPFVKHFGWIVRPLPADNPFLEEVKRGFYLSVARCLHEVASVKSCNVDAVSISNLQKNLKTMAETVKLKEEFVSFISQYLDKMLVVHQVKKNAALLRTYEAKLSEGKKAAAELEVEYNKPWQ